jgi:hypothetical protein
MDSGNISISLYENTIPPFVESELERLYRNTFSTLSRFTIYGDITNDTNTYVARENGTAIAVLLFQVSENRVRVLNEQINVDEKEIDRFINYIFATYSSIHVISFRAIRTNLQRLALPYQRFSVSDDIVVTLPDTPDEYLASLGKATRKNIKHHMSRLKRDYPSLRFDVYLTKEISEHHVRSIIELNRARMASKSKESTINHDEERRIIELAKRCGLVSVMTLDGNVCAGAVCLQVDKNYFSVVSGHAFQYDRYRLGMLCFYRTIRESIERGGKEFHFLWGRYEYKYALSGIQNSLDDVIIYRSRLQFFLQGHLALKTALKGYISMGKFWLLDKARQQENAKTPWRPAFHFLNSLRRLKRFTLGLLAWRE